METKQIQTIKLINLCLIIIILFAIGIIPARSQTTYTNEIPDLKQGLKTYKEGLEKEWSNGLITKEISPDGNWIAFKEFFSIKNNVLHLSHTSKNISYTLSDGYKCKFSKNNLWFANISENKELVLIDLEQEKKVIFEGVETFDFSFSGKYMAFIQNIENAKSTLYIRNLETNQEKSFEGVTKFAWNPKNNYVIAIEIKDNLSKTILYDALNDTLEILNEKKYKVPSFLKWNNTGTTALIMEEFKEKNILEIYKMNGNFVALDESLLSSQLYGYELSNREPFISDDGNKVLFYKKKKSQKLPEEDKIEIWNTTDPMLYPNLKRHREYIYSYLLTAWYPEKGIVREIATEELPLASMDVNHSFAIVYDELQYGFQYTELRKADFYIKNLMTGNTKLIVKEQSLQNGLLSISPTGKYLTYFKDNNWWVYSMTENTAKNITKDIKTNFLNEENEYPIQRIEVYNKPAWTENDNKIILSDQYDLWIMQPDGSKARRLTKGREKNNRYTLNVITDSDHFYQLTIGNNFSSKKVNLEKGQFLKFVNYNTHRSGIELLRADYSIEQFLNEDNSFHEIYSVGNQKKIIYYSESTTKPKSIVNYDLKTKRSNVIYQADEELLDYDLGHKKMITYEVDGKELNGALVYPANYEPEKKYPMLVNIYEKKSRDAINFSPPTGLNYQGFDILSYTTSGYFVLLPDITYEITKPGKSALNSVNRAIDKALENKSINDDKIGLIGHSFGGYEAAFIATQTDRFAAIVAGAAVTDFTSHYHGINWNQLNTDNWRYEDQQWRMGLSYYENKKAYLENSPLEFVENIDTPLLIWTGDKDYQVTWTQSLELFVALERLNKKANLILVKDEGHSPERHDTQLLLSSEIKKWFDSYCK